MRMSSLEGEISREITFVTILMPVGSGSEGVSGSTTGAGGLMEKLSIGMTESV